MTLYRDFGLEDCEIRDDGDGRTLVGLCVPYDRPTEIPREGITEVFRFGAFAQQTKAPWRIGLYDGHTDSVDRKLGLCRELLEKETGLFASFRLLSSRAPLVRDMVDEGHSALSVGFEPLGVSPVVNGITERRRAMVAHVALVGKGAYSEANVLALRDSDEPEPHPDSEFWSGIDRWTLDRKAHRV